ncbi:MAG: MMPL family transporter [Streptosporangiaceae bacterium]
MLATLPLVEFTEIGFAVALGVLLDTIVVRSVLVTALTLDLGRHVRWPSALARPDQRSALARPGQRRPSALANPESRSVTGGT